MIAQDTVRREDLFIHLNDELMYFDVKNLYNINNDIIIKSVILKLIKSFDLNNYADNLQEIVIKSYISTLNRFISKYNDLSYFVNSLLCCDKIILYTYIGGDFDICEFFEYPDINTINKKIFSIFKAFTMDHSNIIFTKSDEFEWNKLLVRYLQLKLKKNYDINYLYEDLKLSRYKYLCEKETYLTKCYDDLNCNVMGFDQYSFIENPKIFNIYQDLQGKIIYERQSDWYVPRNDDEGDISHLFNNWLSLEVHKDILLFDAPAGYGKTTTIRKLAAEVIKSGKFIPFYIPLDKINFSYDYTENNKNRQYKLKEIIKNHLTDNFPFYDKLIREGTDIPLIILDGLDELSYNVWETSDLLIDIMSDFTKSPYKTILSGRSEIFRNRKRTFHAHLSIKDLEISLAEKLWNAYCRELHVEINFTEIQHLDLIKIPLFLYVLAIIAKSDLEAVHKIETSSDAFRIMLETLYCRQYNKNPNDSYTNLLDSNEYRDFLKCLQIVSYCACRVNKKCIEISTCLTYSAQIGFRETFENWISTLENHKWSKLLLMFHMNINYTEKNNNSSFEFFIKSFYEYFAAQELLYIIRTDLNSSLKTKLLKCFFKQLDNTLIAIIIDTINKNKAVYNNYFQALFEDIYNNELSHSLINARTSIIFSQCLVKDEYYFITKANYIKHNFFTSFSKMKNPPSNCTFDNCSLKFSEKVVFNISMFDCKIASSEISYLIDSKFEKVIFNTCHISYIINCEFSDCIFVNMNPKSIRFTNCVVNETTFKFSRPCAFIGYGIELNYTTGEQSFCYTCIEDGSSYIKKEATKICISCDRVNLFITSQYIKDTIKHSLKDIEEIETIIKKQLSYQDSKEISFIEEHEYV